MPARKCYDCDLKNYKPEVKLAEKGWLEWKRGSEQKIPYQILDAREKEVKLTINEHKKELLS
jgi:hypothetical protein